VRPLGNLPERLRVDRVQLVAARWVHRSRFRIKAPPASPCGSYGPGRHGFTDTNSLFAG
jgi:hypothetical protein